MAAMTGSICRGRSPTDPLPTQGLQSPLTPRQQYRQGLAALEAYCNATFSGRGFAQLERRRAGQADRRAWRRATCSLPNFSQPHAVQRDPRQHAWKASSPIRSMAAIATWRAGSSSASPASATIIRDVMDKPNQAYTLPPVGMQGRPAWGER